MTNPQELKNAYLFPLIPFPTSRPWNPQTGTPHATTVLVQHAIPRFDSTRMEEQATQLLQGTHSDLGDSRRDQKVRLVDPIVYTSRELCSVSSVTRFHHGSSSF